MSPGGRAGRLGVDLGVPLAPPRPLLVLGVPLAAAAPPRPRPPALLFLGALGVVADLFPHPFPLGVEGVGVVELLLPFPLPFWVGTVKIQNTNTGYNMHLKTGTKMIKN